MKIRIKTGSEPLRAPQPPRRVLPMPRTHNRQPVLAVAPARGPLAPLRWPRTPADVDWTSEPRFGRSPAGWYRIGLHQ